MTSLDTEQTLHGDDKIIAEAKRRFIYCQDKEGECRKLFLEDMMFANGDSNNGWQWPNDIRTNRELDKKPCLTINKTRQHNLQIINEARQNKTSIKIRPVGNEATYEAAEVFEGIIRHIEYISNATVAYDTAIKFQVEGGIGYWRVTTDYIDDDSWDQEIFIKRIKDPLTVYLDPDISEKDGSDALFGFIFDDMKREEAEVAYPQFKDKMAQSAIGNSDSWLDEDHVRVAEYYRRVRKTDKLVAFKHPHTGAQHIVRHSKIKEMGDDISKAVIDDPATMLRDLIEYEVEWFLLIGNQIADRRMWAGTTIPIVRVVGEETCIDGKIDRKGHTRALKDPQRIYNYWSSCAVEFVALQGKSPWIIAAESMEGYENYWNAANTQNFSAMPYKAMGDDGIVLPPPQRAMPPQFAQSYIEGMKISQGEMMMASGQYEANFGQQGNEKSGKAINERQRQGENATYHFTDNQSVAIRRTGKIILELVPKVYDTERTKRILAEDGAETKVMIDPNAQKSYLQKQQKEGEEIKAIFNPKVGKYDVESDVGPNYATKRQEAFNAISQILAQAPELVNLIGDLLFKAADFPFSEEIAERIENMVPPQAKGEGLPPGVAQMQGQLQHMQGLITTLMQQLADEKSKLKTKDAQKDIDVYEAITKRIEVLLKNVVVTPKDNAMMLHDLMTEEHASGLRQVEAASAPVLEQQAQQGETQNAQ